MNRSRLGVLAIPSIVVVLLAGCAPAARGHAGPHHPSHSPSAVVAPTSTPAPTKPALADIVLTPDSLGDITINAPVPSSTLIASFDPAACVSSETGVAAGDPGAGAWKATFPATDPANPNLLPFIVVVNPQTSTGIVSTIWVWSPGIHTAEGIQVGSTRTELLAAYPHPDAVLHGAISDVYIVNGRVGKLDIEVARTDAGDPGYWTDQNNTVLWMGDIAPGGTAGAIAGSDGGPHECASVEG